MKGFSGILFVEYKVISRKENEIRKHADVDTQYTAIFQLADNSDFCQWTAGSQSLA